jgi:hypothetical protein
LQYFGHAAGLQPTFNLDPTWLLIAPLLPVVWMGRKNYLAPLLQEFSFSQANEMLHALTIETVFAGYAGLAIPETLTQICIERNAPENRKSVLFNNYLAKKHERILKEHTPELLQILQENRS